MNVDINGYSVKYLRNNEKELLEKILNIQGASLEEMRIMYIKRLSIFNEVSDMDSDIIITKILDVLKESNASIFELRKLFDFKEVYELDNKIIKFNTSFNIPSDRNILQPISSVKLTSGKALTIFKKLNTEGVYEIENITQIMYNRLRDDGLIWLDVHRENIGILDSELDENDDGLRIIDADKIYNYYDLLNSMEPIVDYRTGMKSKEAALQVYLRDRGYIEMEESYQRKEVENERIDTKKILIKAQIEEIYKDIIMNAFYDEQYAGMAKEIDNQIHGVCIDFSQILLQKLKECNIQAGIISTLNDDGFKHAAVVYKIPEAGKVYIADPVTDVRVLSEVSRQEKNAIIKDILLKKNWMRTPREYLKDYGIITAYDENMNICMENIRDKEEIEAIPTINKNIEKKVKPIQTLTGLDSLKDIIDGPTLLACQALYKKGISTFCSNYTPNGDASVNVYFNSLSEENKKIIQESILEQPENYCIQRCSGFYGGLGKSEEYKTDDSMPYELIFGLRDTSNMTEAEINLKMYNLINMLHSQEYRQGVFTREEILSNKHNCMNARCIGNELVNFKDCNSSEQNSNDEIAQNEDLIYSSKYNLFFDGLENKSRYLESLYRQEHDLRTEDEIAKEAGIIYCRGMFFEDDKDLRIYLQQKQNIDVMPTDIVKADIKMKISHSMIENIKHFFDRIKSKIFRREER